MGFFSRFAKGAATLADKWRGSKEQKAENVAAEAYDVVRLMVPGAGILPARAGEGNDSLEKSLVELVKAVADYAENSGDSAIEAAYRASMANSAKRTKRGRKKTRKPKTAFASNY